MKRILNPNSSFSTPGTRDETNEENLGTDGDENTNTSNNNNNAKMTTSSKDGADDSLLFPSEEHTEEQLVSAIKDCLLYTSPSPRDAIPSRMPSSA